MRANKVRQALLWLKEHNRLYKDIEIDEGVLHQLDSTPLLPFNIEHISPSRGINASTSGYDPSASHVISNNTTGSAETCTDGNNLGDAEIPFSSVVISDMENIVSTSQLAAAAIRHMWKKGGAYLQVPHDPQPANEFFNANLFPMMYPMLFPYGLGGFEDSNCRVKVSMRRHVKH